MEEYKGENMERIENINEKLIESLEHLPPLPQTVQKLQSYMATHGSDIDINEIVQIISDDPLITANLLHLANSPFYGFSSEIKTVNQALVLVGINNVKNMIVADYVKNNFKIDVSPYGLNTNDFLNLCHEQTEFIASWILEEDKKLCYTLIPIVMLLRLGIMVFSSFLIQNNLDKKFLLHLSKNNYNNILALEKEFFGVEHVAFLATLFKSWNFDESFIECISSMDYVRSASANIKKETYALCIVETLFSPEVKKDYEFCVKRAYQIIKEAKINGVDFNLENFIAKLPHKFKKYLK